MSVEVNLSLLCQGLGWREAVCCASLSCLSVALYRWSWVVIGVDQKSKNGGVAGAGGGIMYGTEEGVW